MHSALWRQQQGWCGPWWKWVWHPCSSLIWFAGLVARIFFSFISSRDSWFLMSIPGLSFNLGTCHTFLLKCECITFISKNVFILFLHLDYVLCGYNSFLEIIYSLIIFKILLFSPNFLCCSWEICHLIPDIYFLIFLSWNSWPFLFISGVLKFHNNIPSVGPSVVFARQ